MPTTAVKYYVCLRCHVKSEKYLICWFNVFKGFISFIALKAKQM